jgi:preprotein translocase SecF subunit
MRSTAVKALVFGLIAMMIYVIFSFWTIRKYIAPGILATVVLLSSILSISLPAGAYGLWMWIDSTIQIDTVFIIAILTIIGYWINDVIIIFDRARENIMNHSKKEFSYRDVLEDSIWQTFRRSIGTSLSTMLVLCSMFIFGTWVVQRFAFTVWVWVIASFLSSLFVAIPTAYILLRLTDKKIK